MENVIIVFKVDEVKRKTFSKVSRFYPNTWSIHNAPPTKSRLLYLEEKGVDIKPLLKLTPSERVLEADRLISQVFTPDCEAAKATITSVEPVRNKTQKELFYFFGFDDVGRQLLKGPYNQQLLVNIDLTPIDVTPDMLSWEEESPLQFIDEVIENHLVLNNDIAKSQHSCFSLALGCKLVDGLLIVGSNAKFYFRGINPTKEVDSKYYFNVNKNNGKSISVPADMDVLKFNFHYHKWEEAVANGEYTKKDVVSVAKTENGNYVLVQDNPLRAIVVLSNGEVIEKNIASFDSARLVETKQFSLSKHVEAILDYENYMQIINEKAAQAHREKLNEMHKENKGWYIVELPCCQQDLHRGGHRKRWINWKVLADSEMDAYNKAVSKATEEGYFWFEEATECQIDFYGVWDDEIEEMLREEGLI